jgi:serine/threonine-protein kinase
LIGWQAWGHIVAKVVAGIDASSLTYLQREIELLREISSPYFPTLLFNEVFTENPLTEEKLDERLFITIEERVISLPLSNLRSKYTTDKEVASLLIKLCDALQTLWAHKKRLVHRDLKPDNILVRPDGSIVIIDLGIVRETGAKGITVTSIGGPMSPAYAAPEQVTNDKYSISFKTDFFALGIIAYELLAGFNPFCQNEKIPVVDVMYNVKNYLPTSLHQLGKCSKSFSNLVEHMLQKEPYRRPRTPDLLVQMLKSELGKQ